MDPPGLVRKAQFQARTSGSRVKGIADLELTILLLYNVGVVGRAIGSRLRKISNLQAA
jgi:hypothetical protein